MCDLCKNAIKISAKTLEEITLVRSAFGESVPELISLTNNDSICFNFCPICGKEIGEDFV